MMNKEQAIVFLEELKDFLRLDIGVGEIFGTLGHDAGGVLSHEVLCNDPCCTVYDENGKEITCNLKGRDLKNVEQVWCDLVNIIHKGRDENQFVQKIDDLINTIKSTS